jgi:spore germination protein KC
LAHTVLLTGCWNRRELNDLAVVVALGIDLEGKDYLVTVQVVNPNEVGTLRSSSGSASVVTYTEKGVSIPDALQRMLSKAPRQLYLSHLRVMVFGEPLARKGIIPVLDYIARNHELRNDFYMLVAKQSKAREVLSVVTPFEKVPAESIYSSIMVSDKKWAATGRITLQHFITVLDRGGSNPVLSGVKVSGDKKKGRSNELLYDVRPETLLVHEGLAVFKKDKLVGWLGEDDGKTVNYILNKVSGTIGHVPCPNHAQGTVNIGILKANSKIRAYEDEKGEPAFAVRINFEVNVDGIQCSLDMSDPASVTAIEAEFEKKARENTTNNIREVQKKYGSDIYGFGEALHRQRPKMWAQYKKEWDDHFKKAKIEVKVIVAVRKIGSIVQPLKKEMDNR